VLLAGRSVFYLWPMWNGASVTWSAGAEVTLPGSTRPLVGSGMSQALGSGHRPLRAPINHASRFACRQDDLGTRLRGELEELSEVLYLLLPRLVHEVTDLGAVLRTRRRNALGTGRKTSEDG
jgi:hypothetical protein